MRFGQYPEPRAGATQPNPKPGRIAELTPQDLSLGQCLWGLILADVEKHLPEHLQIYLPPILSALAEVLLEDIKGSPSQRERLALHLRRFDQLRYETDGCA